MTILTVNGWPVYTSYSDPHLGTFPVPGTYRKILGITVPGTLKKILTAKSLAQLWQNFLQDWHEFVNPITTCESFDPRYIGTTKEWSAHAGGAAVDVDSKRLPQHVHRMPADQKERVRILIAWYEILQWGGDWNDGSNGEANYLDEMHTQLSQNHWASQADVNRIVAKGRYVPSHSHSDPPPPVQEDPMATVVRYLAPGHVDAYYTISPEVDAVTGFHIPVARWIPTETARQEWYALGAVPGPMDAVKWAGLVVKKYPPASAPPPSK